MKFIIAGDFYITDDFNKSDLFDSSIKNLFNQADYRIINLEAPITLDILSNKIIKTGPHLRMSEDSAIRFLNQLNIDSVTMANNHVLDYGVIGINETFDILDRYGIDYVGAGINLKAAAKPLIIEKDDIKIAIVNFCENEWSIAEANAPGANPMDIIDNASKIKEVKELADYVIVIVHGGHEYYNLPSPRMQKQYRFYVDQGADIVVGHHTHCISGYEVYKDIPIYYSLGNFLFSKKNPNDEWYTGLVLVLELYKGKIKHKTYPIRQQKESFKLSVLDGTEGEKLLNKVDVYSKIIKNEKQLSDSWDRYIERSGKEYLNMWSPLSFIKSRYVSAVLRRLGIDFLNKKGLSLYLNLLRCEAHRDMSESIFKKYIMR